MTRSYKTLILNKINLIFFFKWGVDPLSFNMSDCLIYKHTYFVFFFYFA